MMAKHGALMPSMSHLTPLSQAVRRWALPTAANTSPPRQRTLRLASCCFSCFFTRSRFSARCRVNGSSTPVCKGRGTGSGWMSLGRARMGPQARPRHGV